MTGIYRKIREIFMFTFLKNSVTNCILKKRKKKREKKKNLLVHRIIESFSLGKIFKIIEPIAIPTLPGPTQDCVPGQPVPVLGTP